MKDRFISAFFSFPWYVSGKFGLLLVPALFVSCIQSASHAREEFFLAERGTGKEERNPAVTFHS